ncbi:helix-turn-helix domain-containing protein [Catellatospora methionotrophica]|nr:helix-turn-helix transcriptional regulator [Catellatospora methionotrophica]
MQEWLTQPGGLATRLRQMRRAAALTGDRLAVDAGWTQSKVSKLENGHQLPTDDDLAVWARACGQLSATAELRAQLAEALGVHREFRMRMRLGQVAVQRDHDELARAARVIRNAETVLVPGLLQVPGYARARIEENARFYKTDAGEIDAAVASRLHRQQVLYDTAKSFTFVVTEAALRILLCPLSDMLAQLDRLAVIAAGGMSHVQFGVIPFGVQLRTTPQHGFLLLDDLAVVETISGETVYEGEEAATYAAAMDDLLAEALTGDQAAEIVTRAATDLRLKSRHSANPTKKSRP